MHFRKYIQFPIFLGIVFTALLFAVHFFFSYFVDNIKILIFLKPIRDFLFFPFLILVENVFEIYCWLASYGLGDYGRCLVPTGPGLNMPIGEPASFELVIFILALIALSFYYISIFFILHQSINNYNFHCFYNRVKSFFVL